jgi:hypothetical protein
MPRPSRLQPFKVDWEWALRFGLSIKANQKKRWYKDKVLQYLDTGTQCSFSLSERGINPVIGQRQNPMAPSITQITSSRMEVAGHVVQLTCKANSKNSNSRHQVDWTVIAEDGSRLENERKVDDGYPFIMARIEGENFHLLIL